MVGDAGFRCSSAPYLFVTVRQNNHVRMSFETIDIVARAVECRTKNEILRDLGCKS